MRLKALRDAGALQEGDHRRQVLGGVHAHAMATALHHMEFGRHAGLLQQVEQGKLALTDDVSDLLGFKVRSPRFPDTPITLEMLLSHTSSINDSQGYWTTIDIINPDCNPDVALCYNDYEPGSGGYEY